MLCDDVWHGEEFWEWLALDSQVGGPELGFDLGALFEFLDSIGCL